MKVLIVDDENLARERLIRMVGDVADCEVVGEAGNGMQAVELTDRLQPDVVLLDIRMPGMDGLECARHLATLEEPPAVIFCTAYDEHALEAFDLQAVGYLLKPVRRDAVREAIERAQRVNKAQLLAINADGEEQRSHIAARTRRGLELIPVDSIRFFQADQKYVTVRHAEGEVIVDETLRELEGEFGERFLRVHRNALVAVKFIEGLERSKDGAVSVRMQGVDEHVDVSRRHVAAVRKFIKTL